MSARNSAYSPLPQSNSDSDGSSEEELHVSQGNRIVNRASKVLNSKSERVQNEQKSIVINYKPLDNDGDKVALSEKFQPSPNEVSIVKPEGGLEIFSSSRKICFVFSLLLCVFTTVAFLWILPCNIGSCFDVSGKSKNFTWEEILPNLEIYGPITLVPDQKSNYNLMFLTKRSSEKNNSENGLRCFKGKDGSLKWKTDFAEEPTDADCNLIDVDADGLNDCLIYGSNFLKAINSLSGNELWDIQKANKKQYKLYFGGFPVVLPDLNGDEVKELLFSCSLVSDDEKPFINYLVIISGKNGEIINKPLQMSACSAIHNLMFEKNILSYTCFLSSEKESFQNISLTEIYKTLKNKTKENQNFYEVKMLNQHIKDSDTVYVNGFRLYLKNQGKCPEACDVVVEIKDEHDAFNSKTVYSSKKKNSFGMTPVGPKTEKVTSFILKFWIWHSKIENLDFKEKNEFPTQKTLIIRNSTKNIKKRSKKLSNSTVLDKEMLLESEWDQQRTKRRAVGLRKSKSQRSVFNLHVLTETIVKIAPNNSQFYESILFKDEIIQICPAQICHPNPYKQKHSVLFAHLNEDEEAKLITFTSKYVHEKEKTSHKSETWQLQSKIIVTSL